MNRPVVVSSDKSTARRRLNDKSEASKVNSNKTGGSETSKRLDKPRLLSPSIKHTEDHQPQLSNVKERSPVSVEMAAPTVKAATVDVICDQRIVADNVDVIESTDAPKELSAVSLQKPAGTCMKHVELLRCFIICTY